MLAREHVIGLIGFGEIGRQITTALSENQLANYRLGAVMTRRIPQAELPVGCVWTKNLEDFLDNDLDIVVEAASVEAVESYADTILAAGLDLMILSVAALADVNFETRLRTVMDTATGRIYIPSGAIGGLDAVSSAMTGGVSRVILTQRKPPASLLSPEEASTVKSARLLSEGTAREAALKFPKNSNIAAALGLAGPGMDKVIVRVIVDPEVSQNTLELEVDGAFGHMQIRQENVPAGNMRTSLLTGMSVVAALNRRAATMVCPA